MERPFGGDTFDFGIPRVRQNGTQEQEVGGGTAFFLSADGLLMTNKHVVSDEKAGYTVLFNDGRKPATDTVWTLHLTTQLLIDTYKNQDGYLFNQTSTYAERGVLWSR